MGLDWNPMARPKDGYEDEFATLFGELTGREPIKRKGLARLKGSTLTESEEAERVERFREITQPPFETLDAPCVGQDRDADQWLRDNLAEGASFDEARRQMQGYRVLDLVPDCDGFPRYSNYRMYDGIDRYSFRGKFVELALEEIDPHLIELGYEKLTAAELLEYADMLMVVALRLADQHGLDLEGDYSDFDSEAPQGKLDILLAAVRWCRFWGKRGHGLEPWF